MVYKKNTEDSLTLKGGLNFLSKLVYQFSRIIMAFIVTPIVIRGLGAELYGAWMMIQQTVGYIARADLRPVGTLKLSLSISQHDDDIDKKKRQIGAALIVWLIVLPIMLLLGASAFYATPLFIKTSKESIWIVQIAFGISVLNVISERLFALPASVLDGMNLGYKTIWLNPTTIVITGITTILAIKYGYNIYGIALANTIGIATSGISRFFIAKTAIPWFGLSKPNVKEVKDFTKVSGWLFLSSVGFLLTHSSDILLVGIILGPASAAIYSTTGAILRMFTGLLLMLVSSGSPGIAGLCGQKNWARLERTRKELIAVIFLPLTTIGTLTFVLNESFLNLWVGDGFFGGNTLNLLLVFVSFIILLQRIDETIITSMLELKQKTIATFISGAFIILTGGIFAYFFGIYGMALGVFLGRLGLVMFFPFLIAKTTESKVLVYFKPFFRPLLTAILLILFAYLFPFFRCTSWVSLIKNGLIIFLFSGVIMYLCGLDQQNRKNINERIKLFLLELSVKLTR